MSLVQGGWGLGRQAWADFGSGLAKPGSSRIPVVCMSQDEPGCGVSLATSEN
jgi:hypothetical protein